MVRKILLICFFTSFMFLFVGCARINTQVTTYYKPSLQFAGKSFSFYKQKKLHQDADNQYDYYANLISQKLSSMGMNQTTLRKADYGIVLIYWVGKGQPEIGYKSIYGQTGSRIVSSDTTGTHTNYGNFGNYNSQTNYQRKPTYGVVGTVPYQYMLYPCFIHFYIMGKNNLKGKPLYQSTLFTTNVSMAPNVIFTTMLQGYLNNFPGVNGQTHTITTFVSRN
ncbi:MAG: hypothetical protein NTZ67_03190 [Gammaproteobacteria bacterium]|nr:hypothetical protein [Gammaproteobacteria bacterium]